MEALRFQTPRKGHALAVNFRKWTHFYAARALARVWFGWMVPALVFAQGSKADYGRANSLAARTENKVFRQRVQAHWLTNQTQFWYRVEIGPKQFEFVLVDATAGTKGPLFDLSQVATAVKAQDPTAPDPSAWTEWAYDGRVVAFRAGDRRWEFEPGTGRLSAAQSAEASTGFRRPDTLPLRTRRTGEPLEVRFLNRSAEEVELYWLDEQGERRSYGRVRPGGERTQNTYAGHLWLVTDRVGAALGVWEARESELSAVITSDLWGGREASEPRKKPEPPAPGTSPDGRWRAVVVEGRLEIRATGENGAVEFRSAEPRGEERYASEVDWSPDSTRLMARRVISAKDRLVQFVEAAPRGQLQPKLHSQKYFKPGDTLPKPRLVLVPVSRKAEIEIDDTLYSNPFTENGDLDGAWSPDGREFRFSYNQRGHQVYRLLAVDGQTGSVRVVVEESSKTYIDWTAKTWRHWLDATRELLWMSERDGWCHLYLYDAAAGQLKNAVTRGDWVVRRVEHVDPALRQVWFYASGILPEQDPYQLHLCRVNFDGSGLVVLTSGDGQHRADFSPDRRWFIDTWSRVDQPPIVELRRSADGGQVCELERADASALLAAGWTLPERFSAKARDGKTEIYGIIVRPSHWDPRRRYPVLEEVYAGPQAAYVPKEFGRLLRAHAFAELGFVVVQVDGLGTSQRSKAIQDYCHKNLADAGFVDRIGWIRAAAVTRPWMDLSRVGIYGGSAGGQNAMRALLDHADFYHAAVADCGCHDNRMDKIWWNEQWLGWPVDDSYVRSSNVVDAHKLRGHLMLIVGELDTNVDPASTMQVVNALEKADKDFELLVMTGTNHGAGETPYASRRRQDFFVRHLLGKTPRWEE